MGLFRKKGNWFVPKGQPLTEMDKKILYWQDKGKLVPRRGLILTPGQIEGVRRSGVINTALLDLVAENIHAGMTTNEIDKLVHEYTISHGATPATLGFEGFPKSCCVSINEEVCHGIPSDDVVLEEGDIVNVDVTTILDGYYADASRMYIIGKTSARKQKLVDVAKECLYIGMEAAKPFGFVGDIGNAIQQHAHKNGFSVVRDLCGHGVGLKFHDDPVLLEKKVYVLLNKPKDYVTTSDDPQQRKTVMDLVKNACPERIYPVGRLDRNTTGVLLLTNDGDLASKLTHPKFLKKKIYHVYLDRNVTAHDLEEIANGITLDDGEIKADAIEYADPVDKKQVGIEIHSGKNRIVRRIFESFGYKVLKLDRVQFAGLTKKNLRRGDWRYLTEDEVDRLRMGAYE